MLTVTRRVISFMGMLTLFVATATGGSDSRRFPVEALIIGCAEELDPGEFRFEGNVLHRSAVLEQQIVVSEEPLLAGLSTYLFDSNTNLRNRNGSFQGNWTLNPDDPSVPGLWNGKFHGQIRDFLEEGQVMANGTGALDGLTLALDALQFTELELRDVVEGLGGDPCADLGRVAGRGWAAAGDIHVSGPLDAAP